MSEPQARRPGLHEVVQVWVLLVALGVAVLVTYARVSPARLYNVSEDGLDGGLGRALVFLNYPGALVAAALLALAADRLRARWADTLAITGALLCAVVAWPGVVDQSDLDAKPANALPALGVLIAFVLTGAALRRCGLGSRSPFRPLDAVRAGLAVLLVAAAVPWVAAELGFSPDLQPVFLTGQHYPEPGHPDAVVVHVGDHHGTDGTLLALAALALSRQLSRLRRRLDGALGLYLALMLVYGLANALQDFWLEQLVKRGATSLELPGMIHPSLSPAWAAIVAAVLLIQFGRMHVDRFQWRRTGGSA